MSATKSPWTLCEKCSVQIASKDIARHSEDCPPDENNIKYGFVKNQTLYACADIKVNDNINNLSSIEKDNLVFLSEGAIRLCSLAIGDSAVIEPVNENIPPYVRTVWPTTEKILTIVMFTKGSYDLMFSKLHEPVIVKKLDNQVPKAAIVKVVLTNAPSLLQINSELYSRLSKTYTDKILSVGNIVKVLFYGKTIKFEIKSIEKDLADFEQNFMEMSLSNRTFYYVHDKTAWEIFSDELSYEKQIREEKHSAIVGIDKEIAEVKELMDACLNPESRPTFPTSHSVLLYGHSGTGKTTLANNIAKESKANIFTISPTELYLQDSGSPEQGIKNIFENALEKSPSVIILDEIDILCPVRTSRLSESEKKIVSMLVSMFDNINKFKNCKVFIIATTNKIDNIDPIFRRYGRLDTEIEIPTPNPNSRHAILEMLLKEFGISLLENELTEISMATHGYVGADLVSLCSTASLTAHKRKDVQVNLEDFKLAMKKVCPSAMREVLIEVPNVRWNDIGGQENIKKVLKQCVEWPLKYAESFSRLGIRPPRGVLMFGPPGCSKTMIAKAVANESGLNFLSIKGPELFSKWVGESEKAIRDVFRKSRQVAPSVIFFDEIDALGSERSTGSSSSVQERVLAQLLTEMDGVSPLGDVTVLAATNRPDKIDKALLRPGRLDRLVYIPLPDKYTRKEIFLVQTKKMKVHVLDLDYLVDRTEGYSGAEIVAICHEAAMFALEEDLNIDKVEQRHFEQALKIVTPRTPNTLIELYKEYLEKKT